MNGFAKVVRFLINPIAVVNRISRFIYYKYDTFLFHYVGKGTIIDRPVIKLEGKKYICIGDSCYIGKNARIEAVCKYNDKLYIPQIKIGNDVCINQNFHCTCASSISIGNGTSITANCGIFDIVHPYTNISLNPRIVDIETIPIVIGENCLIGMNSVLLPGTTLGDHCIVGANSTLNSNYPSYTVIVGSPAKIVKRYCFESESWKKTDPKGEFVE